MAIIKSTAIAPKTMINSLVPDSINQSLSEKESAQADLYTLEESRWLCDTPCAKSPQEKRPPFGAALLIN